MMSCSTDKACSTVEGGLKARGVRRDTHKLSQAEYGQAPRLIPSDRCFSHFIAARGRPVPGDARKPECRCQQLPKREFQDLCHCLICVAVSYTHLTLPTSDLV